MSFLGFNSPGRLDSTTFTYSIDGPLPNVTQPSPSPSLTGSEYFTYIPPASVDMASTASTPIFTTTTYPNFINTFTAPNQSYFSTSNEEPAITRNAELIKGIKELQTKMKCMKDGADDFFQKPQAVIIYFEMMMESIFKGKV